MTKFLRSFFCLLLFSASVTAQPHLTDLRGTGISQPSFIPAPAALNSGLRSLTFDVTYTGFDSVKQAAFQYALDIWSVYLISAVPIKVNAILTALPPGNLGITLPNGRKNFPNAPVSDAWYSTALANSLADSELNVGEEDFDLFLNSTANWYFGTDGQCPANQYDFVSVALHEMAHGLGFVGLAKDSAGLGSFGMIHAGDFAPIVTSFPFPDLQGLPGIFDLSLYDAFDEQLANTLLFQNNSAQLSDELTSNAVFWEGMNGTAANAGVYPKVYAPVVFSLGSSMVHLDDATFPTNNINRLMTPFISEGEVTHDPGPVTLGIMKDIGWKMTWNVGVETVAGEKQPAVFPNPVHHDLQLTGLDEAVTDIEIHDYTGRILLHRSAPHFPLDVSHLPQGIFLCTIKTAHHVFNVSFIRQ